MDKSNQSNVETDAFLCDTQYDLNMRFDTIFHQIVCNDPCCQACILNTSCERVEHVVTKAHYLLRKLINVHLVYALEAIYLAGLDVVTSRLCSHATENEWCTTWMTCFDGKRCSWSTVGMSNKISHEVIPCHQDAFHFAYADADTPCPSTHTMMFRSDMDHVSYPETLVLEQDCVGQIYYPCPVKLLSDVMQWHLDRILDLVANHPLYTFYVCARVNTFHAQWLSETQLHVRGDHVEWNSIRHVKKKKRKRKRLFGLCNMS